MAVRAAPLPPGALGARPGARVRAAVAVSPWPWPWPRRSWCPPSGGAVPGRSVAVRAGSAAWGRRPRGAGGVAGHRPSQLAEAQGRAAASSSGGRGAWLRHRRRCLGAGGRWPHPAASWPGARGCRRRFVCRWRRSPRAALLSRHCLGWPGAPGRVVAASCGWGGASAVIGFVLGLG